MQEATLLFVVQEGKILLIRKKRGIGAGKYNGPGGKVEPGEDPLSAAIRETREEVGIFVDPRKTLLAGTCFFYKGEEGFMKVFVYKTDSFSGDPSETEEALPGWFDLDRIPFGEMWPDDEIWFPLMLSGRRFEGTFWFDSGMGKIVRHDLRVI